MADEPKRFWSPFEPLVITPEIEAEAGPEFMARLRSRQRAFTWAKMEVDIEPCPHCGRCVLAGPPCCQGMIDAMKAAEDAKKAEEEAARAARREEKRQRRLARRSERRKAKGTL